MTGNSDTAIARARRAERYLYRKSAEHKLFALKAVLDDPGVGVGVGRDTPATTPEQFHWEHPEPKEQTTPTIHCDADGCDWTGTAYASQFAVHWHRRHADTESDAHA